MMELGLCVCVLCILLVHLAERTRGFYSSLVSHFPPFPPFTLSLSTSPSSLPLPLSSLHSLPLPPFTLSLPLPPSPSLSPFPPFTLSLSLPSLSLSLSLPLPLPSLHSLSPSSFLSLPLPPSPSLSLSLPSLSLSFSLPLPPFFLSPLSPSLSPFCSHYLCSGHLSTQDTYNGTFLCSHARQEVGASPVDLPTHPNHCSGISTGQSFLQLSLSSINMLPFAPVLIIKH